ncbi:hypothetical protein GGF32_009065 [Allomyces javanicus]|nr:hypothetical protein GGF32_009065 [Allomyces javanicus]
MVGTGDGGHGDTIAHHIGGGPALAVVHEYHYDDDHDDHRDDIIGDAVQPDADRDDDGIVEYQQFCPAAVFQVGH